ncbi:Uncharacterised protein [Mycobacteroides abscessus subsp. massiliense]|nr:Uncharacterised protein [Mycobacteroides abscessus subsp. massiliense]
MGTGLAATGPIPHGAPEIVMGLLDAALPEPRPGDAKADGAIPPGTPAEAADPKTPAECIEAVAGCSGPEPPIAGGPIIGDICMGVRNLPWRRSASACQRSARADSDSSAWTRRSKRRAFSTSPSASACAIHSRASDSTCSRSSDDCIVECSFGFPPPIRFSEWIITPHPHTRCKSLYAAGFRVSTRFRDVVLPRSFDWRLTTAPRVRPS